MKLYYWFKILYSFAAVLSFCIIFQHCITSQALASHYECIISCLEIFPQNVFPYNDLILLVTSRHAQSMSHKGEFQYQGLIICITSKQKKYFFSIDFILCTKKKQIFVSFFLFCFSIITLNGISGWCFMIGYLWILSYMIKFFISSWKVQVNLKWLF